ncbi:sialate O-acetylesterase [Phocaeicola paurosaccharolyticus]|uniref:sialate O-acetylesterase n=1 Tax=Phocaeicola paurosaccharolyticus TaxID=732242 RepID=UPI0034E2C2CF
MINPILNLKFKGAMWYQGESNTGQSNEYEALLLSMIGDWRERFNDREIPFVVVQLPNFMQHHKNPVESGWAGLREAQRQVTMKLPMTALTVAIDLGEWNDIHPLNKKDLAFRIAQQMEKMAYKNSKVISDGPICEKAVLKDGKIEISFKEGTDKLIQEKNMKGFAVQADRTPYRWVKASTVGNKVILEGEFKGKVLKVRYGWDDNPTDISLKNEAGLPASPFQIDVQ